MFYRGQAQFQKHPDVRTCEAARSVNSEALILTALTLGIVELDDFHKTEISWTEI